MVAKTKDARRLAGPPHWGVEDAGIAYFMLRCQGPAAREKILMIFSAGGHLRYPALTTPTLTFRPTAWMESRSGVYA